MANEEFINTFKSLISECAASNADSLLSNAQWGIIHFEGCRPELQRTYDILNELNILPLELLPLSPLQQFHNALVPVRETINKIQSFSLENQPNPTGVRDQLVNDLRNQADTFFMVTHGFIPYLAYRKGDVQRNINELTQSVREAGNLLDEAQLSIAEKKAEIDSIITAAREASASVGVAHFTADFGNEAGENQKQGKRWLIATAIFAILTIFASIAMMFLPLSNDATAAQIVRFFASKVVFLAILFSATIWCGRLYKASKHLETLNKHRSNALKTFQAFVKAASDDPTRDAVLMETTRSIFMIAPSGYLDSADVSSDGGMKVVEVIKNISQVGK